MRLVASIILAQEGQYNVNIFDCASKDGLHYIGRGCDVIEQALFKTGIY